MLPVTSSRIYCPLLQREIEEGYCWELCNIATDDILLDGDRVANWDDAQKVCRKCGRYEDTDS